MEASIVEQIKNRKGRRFRTARRGKKIGRNEPCSCGSGIKYKKCCGIYK